MKSWVAAVLCVSICGMSWPVAHTQDADSGNKTCPAADTSKTVVIEKITHIRVAVLLDSPFVQHEGSTVDRYEGIFIDVLDELTRRLNLTYTVVGKEDTHGRQVDSGNWTGLIGGLTRNTSDLAVAPLTISSAREDAIDFTQPVVYAGLRILYKMPSSWTEGEPFALLLTPFTAGLWILVLLMFLAVSVLFYIIGRFSPYEDHAFVGKAATYEGLTLVNSFLYVFSSLTFQGYTAAPRSMSGRVLAAFWWMFTMLVIAAYTASLAAIFLAMKPSVRTLPFATFEELSRQTEVAYGVVANGSAMRYLQNSKRPVPSRLWGTILANRDNVNTKSVNEGVRRVLDGDGKYAFIMEGPFAEHLSQQPPCSLMAIGEPLNEHAYAFACRPHTDLCNKLNAAILQLHEEDFIYDTQQKWRNQGCLVQGGEYLFHGLPFFDAFGGVPDFFALRTVTLRRFSIGFLLIFIGICVSAFVLVAEIFIAKRRGTAVPQRLPRGKDDQQPIEEGEYRDEV